MELARMRHLYASAAAATAVLSQTPPIAEGSGWILKMLMEFGALGVLGWYCWYVTKTTLPKLTDQFREENAEQRKHDTERTEKICTTFERTTDRNAALMEKMITSCRATQVEQRDRRDQDDLDKKGA